MEKITDTRGNIFPLSYEPQRIVSMVPSTTETLFGFGLQHRVVGVTRYCVHPEGARKQSNIIGGTKTINLETLTNCRPDLVLANQEENKKEIVEQIQTLNIPCYVSFPKTVNEALLDLYNLGQLLGREEQAQAWLNQIATVRNPCQPSLFRYAYLIWRKPWMSLNQDTFISSMLEEVGGQNIFSDKKERYFECSIEEIQQKSPTQIFLSSEPYPFQKKHINELIDSGFQKNQIHLIDGEMCSWHGIRMAKGLQYLQQQKTKWY